MAEYSVLGKPTPRVDGFPKVTGAARYAGDLELPGMLYGAIVRSPHAHARVLNVDTSRAERMPGVKAVVTGADFVGFKYGMTPETRDESPLAFDKVRFVGDEVAAVCAIDEDLALEAAAQIEVEYEPLPAVFDPFEAMKPGAPQLHDDKPGNVSGQLIWDFGDLEKAWADSYIVREDTFFSQSVLHGFLEPHACVALWENPDSITIWPSKQSPYYLYRNLATAFRLPLSKVRLIQPSIGGGFGGKSEGFALDFAAVLLSKRSGKPVKIVYDQEHVLTTGRRRHPMALTLKMGATREGKILGIYQKIVADGGAYTATGRMTLYLCGTLLSLPYVLPAFRHEAYRIYTNKPCSVAQRGHGLPQVRYAVDCQLDLIAKELGIDPVEIRMRNAIEVPHVTVNQIHVKSCGVKECIEKAAASIDWTEARARAAQTHGQRVVRGVGIACNTSMSGARIAGHSACSAIIKVHEDGTVSLMSGSTDSGQGAETVLAQITAEVLGIPVSAVIVYKPDSAMTPVDPGTWGSRVTSTAGNAVLIAAKDVRSQLAKKAAELLEAREEDMEFRDQKVFVKGSPDRQMKFRDLCRLAYIHGRGAVVIGNGHWAQDIAMPNWDNGVGDVGGAYSFGAQAAEVEIDTETGKVHVTKMVVAHDLGFAINPLIIEGQHEGSIAGGLGHALLEEMVVDDNGQTLNPSFLDYRMATALDMPEQIASYSVETDDPSGPFGAKESGEGTQISTVPAIVNAIYDAIGVMMTELPITPEKISQAIARKERGS
ncbi:MAG: molybdopterin-dependent oxidoreductase [Chloroflexi bacterium]|nr:molybdopterin-dependent oxidoreductase [Chloroflexota bacterium]